MAGEHVDVEALLVEVVGAIRGGFASVSTEWPETVTTPWVKVVVAADAAKWLGFYSEATVLLYGLGSTKQEARAVVADVREALHDSRANQTVYSAGWLVGVDEVSGVYPVEVSSSSPDGTFAYALSVSVRCR